jgi:hypothetical protein
MRTINAFGLRLSNKVAKTSGNQVYLGQRGFYKARGNLSASLRVRFLLSLVHLLHV